MSYIFAIIFSLLICVMAIIRPSDEKAVMLKKFTYKKQRLVSCLVNAAFFTAVLVTGICLPQYEIICMLLAVVQFCINAIFISVLRIVGEKKFKQSVIDEILRLNVDVNEDPVVIRRVLMENSETSYSIKDIRLAVEAILSVKINKDE